MDKSAKIEIDVAGTEKAAAALRGALTPATQIAQQATSAWRSFRSEVSNAVGGVVQDLGRVITVGSSISFAGAVAGVQTFEKAASQLAVATGRSFDSVRGQINDLSKQLSEKPEQIANYIANVGKGTYDFGYAQKSLESFRKFALETGRELNETSPLASAFKRMNVSDVDAQLKQLRGTAQQLGTSGGVAALSDQVAALSGAFSRTSNSASQLIAITAQLGKGLNPAQAAEVQQGVVGHFVGAQRQYEVHFRSAGLLKPGETLIDRKTGQFDVAKAMRLRQEELRRMSPEKAFQIASGNLGSPMAAARFLAADLSGQGAAGMDTNALQAYGATPGGRRDAADAARDRNMQGVVGTGSFLGDANDWFRGFSAEHPLAGKAGELGISAGLGYGGAMLKGAIAGKGAAAAGAAVPDVAVGTGTVLAGAALPLATLIAGIVGTGAVLHDVGEDRDVMGAKWRSGNSAVEAERFRIARDRGKGDPLETFRAALKLGASKEEAEMIARAVADAVAKVKIQVNNYSDAAIEVEVQPGAEQ